MKWFSLKNFKKQKCILFDQGILLLSKLFQKVLLLVLEYTFGIQGKIMYSSFSSLNKNMFSVKLELVLNNIQFTTVTNHDSWEASTENNVQNNTMYKNKKG